MDNKLTEQGNIGERDTSTRASALNISENLNRKYPYVTAYVGFVILYIFSWVKAVLITAVFLLIYSLIRYGEIGSLVNIPLTLMVQIVIGFDAFKYVVKKNILPYSKK